VILTDGSAEAKQASGWPGEWTSSETNSLPPAERELWRALGGGSRLWSQVPEPAPGYWTRIFLFRNAPASQFDVLQNLLGQGLTLPGPIATLALTGENFHGHRRRSWAAAAGNLHLCVALAPGVAAADFGLALTMLPAVAVVDAITKISAGALKAGIKWVNDILLSGRKVAGVLTTTQTQGDRLEYVVLGIGLNIVVAPAVAVTPFVPEVGCLREFSLTAQLTLPEVSRVVLDALAAVQDRSRTSSAVTNRALVGTGRFGILTLTLRGCSSTPTAIRSGHPREESSSSPVSPSSV